MVIVWIEEEDYLTTAKVLVFIAVTVIVGLVDLVLTPIIAPSAFLRAARVANTKQR